MHLSELVIKLGESVDSVMDALEKDGRRKKFFLNHSEEVGNDYIMDSYAKHVVIELCNTLEPITKLKEEEE